ncbi:NADAR family protein [Rhodococcus hoagii]|nr:NADAR family protein [Prescottella equi]
MELDSLREPEIVLNLWAYTDVMDPEGRPPLSDGVSTSATEVPIIDFFEGDYAFLSNFYEAGVIYNGLRFSTSEHAFAAAKTDDLESMYRIMNSPNAADINKVGCRVKLVDGWDRVKYRRMEEILWTKFTHNHELGDMLLGTMGSVIIEGNIWHDQVCGSCSCPRHRNILGDNALGTILMNVRMKLALEDR